MKNKIVVRIGVIGGNLLGGKLTTDLLRGLDKFVDILAEIENCEEDQHSAAHKVGKYLKELYIDSALREAEQREDKEEGEKPKQPARQVTYTQFKKKKRRGKV